MAGEDNIYRRIRSPQGHEMVWAVSEARRLGLIGEKEFVYGTWYPMDLAPTEDYAHFLAAVELADGDLDHRIAMYDPEFDGWTAFLAHWRDTKFIAWTPLPPLPPTQSIG